MEEKTLTIRKRKTISPGLALSIASMREGKPWTKGGSDGTAESTQCGEEGPEIEMGKPNLGRDTKMGIHHGPQAPGPGQEAPSRSAICGVNGDHGESEMKERDVLVKVYEPGRLQRAWQRVRQNAGAAGIDQMVFRHDCTSTFSRT